MITFPPEFVTTKFPGYFWNTKTQRLFSIKVSGVLHELKQSRPTLYNLYKNGYHVSVKGQRRWLLIDDLKKLNSQEIPVAYK